MWIVLLAALLAPAVGTAQISCARGGLQRAVDLYIAAQTSGDPSSLPLAAGVSYVENMAPAAGFDDATGGNTNAQTSVESGC